ncbi:rab-like protein 6 isoform X2 [Clavelina lepadiformis]|uniref:rab-like protein 6 isoform X2 n=1 Tax=Clavelina lepadiformis TaxID=159417 RepID=UPI004041626D
MFTSFKKWVRNDENAQERNPPAGLQTMRSDLQRKFSKGVQYNLKIIIRGDRNTGKTCLWHRLQGHNFIEEYAPTPQIQVASIHWNYKATDDIVKVDVWDVVDQGKPKKNKDTLILSHKEEEDPHTLDASFLDVYKGAHAVIMVFDITKKWTFQYIEKELPTVPAHIPVLILANHRDMGDHRVIDLDELQSLCRGINRPPGSAGIFFLESSMENGFGLKYIHKFFNLPFLLLQRESLLKQLETNHLDVESCLEEIQYEPHSEEQNFNVFLKMLQEKNQPKKEKPLVASSKETSPVNVDTPSAPGAKPTTPQSRVASSAPEMNKPSPPSSLALNGKKEESKKTDAGLFSPSMMTAASTPNEQPQKAPEPEKRGFMSRFFRGSSSTSATQDKPKEATTPLVTTPTTPPDAAPHPVKNIHDFIPDEGAVDGFLDEIPDTDNQKRHVGDVDSSSDDDGGNPMVAGFQEELDSDDQIPGESHKVYTYSDSDQDYVTPHTPKPQSHVSSRSKPVSRISPKPRKEDKKLQHLVIESDSSKEEEAPVVLADQDSLSDDDYLHGQGTIPVIKQSLQVKDDTARNENGKPLNRTKPDDAKMDQHEKRIDIDLHDYSNKPVETVKLDQNVSHSSSDEDASNAMVSTCIDDIHSDENSIVTKSSAMIENKDADEESQKDSVEAEDNKETKLSFQLQSSDFDFLEQISTKATEKPAMPTEGHQSRKSQSKKKHRESKAADEGSKKHKHKKKKSKIKDMNNASVADASTIKKKRKSSRHKTPEEYKEEKDLEDFLGGGEGYDSI